MPQLKCDSGIVSWSGSKLDREKLVVVGCWRTSNEHCFTLN